MVISLSIISIYIHDNPERLTSIDNINQGLIPVGTNVTVKGVIIEIRYYFLGSNDQIVTITNGECNLTFFWLDSPLDLGWKIIVSGTVDSTTSLRSVSIVERVLLF